MSQTKSSIYQRKDERAHKNLEKKHHYDNFNNNVGLVDAFFIKLSRLPDKTISSFQ